MLKVPNSARSIKVCIWVGVERKMDGGGRGRALGTMMMVVPSEVMRLRWGKLSDGIVGE